MAERGWESEPEVNEMSVGEVAGLLKERWSAPVARMY